MSISTGQTEIVETSRGLSVAGTRITLYDILDYVHDGWPARQIAAWLHLSDAQVQAALAYIESHRAQVEQQYQDVLRQAEENRAFWEHRIRDRQARIDAQAARPDQQEIRARIRQRRER